MLNLLPLVFFSSIYIFNGLHSDPVGLFVDFLFVCVCVGRGSCFVWLDIKVLYWLPASLIMQVNHIATYTVQITLYSWRGSRIISNLTFLPDSYLWI